MKFATATNLNRKSGVAQWRDLCVDALSWKCFRRELLSAVKTYCTEQYHLSKSR